jgi:hypothetical protein
VNKVRSILHRFGSGERIARSATSTSGFLILRVIIGTYAAGSIRVVMTIRFQALITVIAHTS